MINIKDIIKNLLRENLDNTLNNITEHLQQADKIYFNTGKLSPKIKEQILKITFVDPNQLSLFESIRKKLLNEYISQDMIYLKDYFNMPEIQKKKYLPHEYPYEINNFLIDFSYDNDFEFTYPKDSVDVDGEDTGNELEGYELVEWIEKNNPKLYNAFADWLYKKINDFSLDIPDFDYPAWAFFDSPELIKNQWLIHFTNNADNIANNGFVYGVNDINKLGLTTHLGDFEKKYGGYNFAFTINDYRRYYNNKFGYGKEAVIFKASGIKLYHNSDMQQQVIFYGNTANNIIPITAGENRRFGIFNKKNGRIIYENDNFNKVVDWVINHYIQYKNKI